MGNNLSIQNECADLEHSSECGNIAGSLLGERKLTLNQAASAMGLSKSTLRRMVSQGDLPVIRFDGRWLFLQRDIEAYLVGRYGRITKAKAPTRNKPLLPDRWRNSSVLQKA